MVRALETAMAGYAARAGEIDRVAHSISKRHGDSEVAQDIVSLIVHSHAAEANLMVAKVADSLGESLLHIIA